MSLQGNEGGVFLFCHLALSLIDLIDFCSDLDYFLFPLTLVLFFSYFPLFIMVDNEVIYLRPFFFPNINIWCYKFPPWHSFSSITQILLHCTFIQFKIPFKYSFDFFFVWPICYLEEIYYLISKLWRIFPDSILLVISNLIPLCSITYTE